MGTCSSADSQRKRRSFQSPQPSNHGSVKIRQEKTPAQIQGNRKGNRWVQKFPKIPGIYLVKQGFVCLSLPPCCTCACACAGRSETLRSYVSVRGSEGESVTGSVCIAARCEEECDVSECSGCWSRPAPLSLLELPFVPVSCLTLQKKHPLFAPQTLLSLLLAPLWIYCMPDILCSVI